MIVSWKWLSEYVDLNMPLEELELQLMLTGLNHEGTETVGEDTAIDLEVTSNRPDCLGHLGVAREISVIWDEVLTIPDPQPEATGADINELLQVRVETEKCTRYTARLIRGIKVGPSPQWLKDRLTSLGIATVNNIVDVTNFVMMECGQPLHAFDFAKIYGGKLIIRHAQTGEIFTAIDHRDYELTDRMCVIADPKQSHALAGVMGGKDSEISDTTVDLLIESADFDPLTVRGSARSLVLHSPSSYRFERGVDPVGIDWASRRCCELILQVAGGTLAQGVIDLGEQPVKAPPIRLRFAQLERIIGVKIPPKTARNILTELGLEETSHDEVSTQVIPPTWRADLTREIDLIEEVARIYGYDKIPQNVGVTMVASTRSLEERLLAKIQNGLTATGFNEALTISSVSTDWIEAFRPWSTAEPLQTSTPVLRGTKCLRQSLVPSLLASRRANEKLSNLVIELFEIAKIYLPSNKTLPVERKVVAFTSGRDLLTVKGILEAIVASVSTAKLTVQKTDHALLDPALSCELLLNNKPFGVLGEVSQKGLTQFGLRHGTTIAEFDLETLLAAATRIPVAKKISNYPPVKRDLNLVLEDRVRWSEVEAIVREKSGELLEAISFQETYRDKKRLGAGKKSLLFSIQLRSPTETLTNEEADAVREKIVRAVAKKLGGQLRA